MAVPTSRTDAPIGVLCALPEELALLRVALEGTIDEAVAGISASSGMLDGLPIVLAEAGVGKVNAATSATLLADRFGCSALVLSGVAGGLSDALDIGDLVIADRVVDIDHGRITDEERILYHPAVFLCPAQAPRPATGCRPLWNVVFVLPSRTMTHRSLWERS
jgi:nucleoside phosphorylase